MMIRTIILPLVFLCCVACNPKSVSSSKNAKQTMESVNEIYYLKLVCNRIPSGAERAEMEDRGITFIDYRGSDTYTVRLTKEGFANFNSALCNLETILGEEKLTSSLQREKLPSYATRGTDILINAITYEDVDGNYALDVIRKNGFTTLPPYLNRNKLSVQIARDQLVKLANLPFIRSLELTEGPSIAE